MKKLINLIILLIIFICLIGCNNNTNSNNNNNNNSNTNINQDEINKLEKQIQELTSNYNIMIRTHKTRYETNVSNIQNQMKSYQNNMFIGDLSNYQLELNRLNNEEQKAILEFGVTKDYITYDAKLKSIKKQRDDLKKLYDNRLKYDELNNQITKLTNEYNNTINQISTTYNNDLIKLKSQLDQLKK